VNGMVWLQYGNKKMRYLIRRDNEKETVVYVLLRPHFSK
jgi:hypothetical protein